MALWPLPLMLLLVRTTVTEQGFEQLRWAKPKRMERVNYVEPLNSIVKLRCAVVGSPKPTIGWTKDGKAIDEVFRPTNMPPYVQKPERWELRIPGLVHSDAGNYTCTINNTESTLTHTFLLEPQNYLTHKPELEQSSGNITVMVGMPATLSCDFRSDLATITYWVRPKGGNVDEDFDRMDMDNFRTLTNPEDGSIFLSNVLHVPAATLADSGLYICVGKNRLNFTFYFLSLTVLSPKEAVPEAPHNQTARIGEPAVMICQTHLSLMKYISWIRYRRNQDQLLARSTGALRIDNVTKDDEGLYGCVLGEGKTKFVEMKAFLNVESNEVIGNQLPTNHRRLQIIAVSVSIMSLVLFITVIFIYKRCQREKVKKQQAIANAHAVTQWTKKVIIERQVSSLEPDAPVVAPVIRIEKQNSMASSSNRSRLGSENTTLTTVSEYELPLDPEWEVPRRQLVLGTILGEGHFGKVIKAVVLNMGPKTVAVKMLKEGHTDQAMIDLAYEMDMMKMVGRHINIINLLGVCTQDGPLYVIVEYAEYGNLRDYLRKHKDANEGYERPNSERPSISERQLILFARQVCKGMEYLGSRKCIHRDLAARNVLVATDLVIKIADFGLARDVHKNDYYRKVGDGWLPVRWMSPEALFQRTYTTRSDVWSFGILLWEIMTLGASPYPSVPSVEKLYQLIRDGHRMERPSNCSIDVYMVMRDCWNFEASRRPSFSELVEDFDRILINAREVEYLEMGVYNDSTTLSSNSVPPYGDAHQPDGSVSIPLEVLYANNGGGQLPAALYVNQTPYSSVLTTVKPANNNSWHNRLYDSLNQTTSTFKPHPHLASIKEGCRANEKGSEDGSSECSNKSLLSVNYPLPPTLILDDYFGVAPQYVQSSTL